jgi:hypothetical protein
MAPTASGAIDGRSMICSLYDNPSTGADDPFGGSGACRAVYIGMSVYTVENFKYFFASRAFIFISGHKYSLFRWFFITPAFYNQGIIRENGSNAH